jgi:hypothetical protein
MMGLLGITMQEMTIECNQNRGCDRNMNLQVATKFDCATDRKYSGSIANVGMRINVKTAGSMRR